eukprot:gene9050-10724_t
MDSERKMKSAKPQAASSASLGGAFAKILGKRNLKGQGALERLEKKAKQKSQEEKEEALAQSDVRLGRERRKALKHRGHVPATKPGEDPESDAYERRLLITSTKGVVGLFNAVRKEQREIEEEEGRAAPTLSAQSKSSFLTELRGAAMKSPGAKTALEMLPASQPQPAANTSSWEVFRDDFLTGRSKLKDWDKGEAPQSVPGEEIFDDDSDGD